MGERTYTSEDIERFVAALAAVAGSTGQVLTQAEAYSRLVTIQLSIEDLAKQLKSTRPGDAEINWVQYQAGHLESGAASVAERYGRRRDAAEGETVAESWRTGDPR